MSKKHSKKFWFIFWTISVLFLLFWYIFLQLRNNKFETLESLVNYFPMSIQKKQEFKSVIYFADYLLMPDGKEKKFLILFQNNMELRPGGGFIGSFGILKVKNGKVLEISTHDLSNFDGRIPSTIEPPYPMKETLRIDSWKLRDSNWSPDFSENAKKAEFFYKLGEGKEDFDGIVAINSNVLTSFLKVTGPISIPEYPGTYDSENAILSLEYQVEKGYVDQGIEKGERKSVMNELAKVVIEKISNIGNAQKIELAKIILEDLNRKDIQLYFKNEELQNQAMKAGWSGKVESNWKKDYIMIIDANLGSYKSDYYIKRSFDYQIDLSKNVPESILKITYTHTGKTKDWMTKDYLSYLRVYVPANSWLTNSSGLNDTIKFGSDFSKKSFGSLVNTPLNQTNTVEFHYSLPASFDTSAYDLLIQKQSGVIEVPGKVTIIPRKGERQVYDFVLTKDWRLSQQK